MSDPMEEFRKAAKELTDKDKAYKKLQYDYSTQEAFNGAAVVGGVRTINGTVNEGTTLEARKKKKEEFYNHLIAMLSLDAYIKSLYQRIDILDQQIEERNKVIEANNQRLDENYQFRQDIEEIAAKGENIDEEDRKNLIRLINKRGGGASAEDSTVVLLTIAETLHNESAHEDLELLSENERLALENKRDLQEREELKTKAEDLTKKKDEIERTPSITKEEVRQQTNALLQTEKSDVLHEAKLQTEEISFIEKIDKEIDTKFSTGKTMGLDAFAGFTASNEFNKQSTQEPMEVQPSDNNNTINIPGIDKT